MGLDKDDPQPSEPKGEVEYTEPPDDEPAGTSKSGTELDKPKPGEPRPDAAVEYTEPPD